MTNDSASSTPPASLQSPKKNGGLLVAEPQFILDREETYPGAAAVTNLLLPYYRSATNALGTQERSHTLERVPETYMKEGRDQLTQLQGLALQAQIAGDTKLAGEIRDVASHLGAMMKSIEQVCDVKKAPGAARFANGGSSHEH